MKYQIFNFQKTALHVAVQKGNIKIVQLLLANKKIDVNILCILKHDFFFIKFKINLFNSIPNKIIF